MRKCTECKTEKPENEFNSNGYTYLTNGTKTKSYKSKCKSCLGAYQKRAFHKKVEEILAEQGDKYACVLCGYDKHTAALEFHHLDPGEKDIMVSRMTTYSKDKIRAELEKCVVLCSNCHRIEHSVY